MKFTPDDIYCPESALCGLCQNDDNCDEAGEEDRQMLGDCTICLICKVKR